MAGITHQGKTVFGLDIGTRSIVGTVGYKTKDRFVVIAQKVLEHETRAMLDGQIHDIKKVGETISAVKAALEEETGSHLEGVCIAAAGRVLRTVTTHVDYDFSEDRVVQEEDVYALSAIGVEQAYGEFLNGNDTDMKFYCVGHSVIRYYMNHYPIGNPQEHKAGSIGADMIVTFLPEDVVDGLYRAVEYAGLKVENLTLEPIAAIQVAIPEKFRMLNIALVDVGAGTSDISITKEGAIVSYGMIPVAGDSITETIAQHCLVDFNTAEQIKRSMEQACALEEAAKAAGRAVTDAEKIAFTDIMGLPQHISAGELAEVIAPAIDNMTGQVAECIKALNGDKAVSAVFVVGGGGKIPGYTEKLSEKLDIVKERVAIRGGEVMGMIDFPEGVEKSSLLVTPIGICLTFYEQNNNFIFVTFNEERIKIYDNGKLSVVDVAMQAEFPNDGLFPKRGSELNYTVEGKARIKRGELGEAAIITVNGEPADIHTPVKGNDVISVMPSTAGAPAGLEIGSLPEYHQSITIGVNGQKVVLPKFARVNGKLQSAYYEIQNGDNIEMQNFYTVAQILEFMDVILPQGTAIAVNNVAADRETAVYENFSVVWGEAAESIVRIAGEAAESIVHVAGEAAESIVHVAEEASSQHTEQEEAVPQTSQTPAIHDIVVMVNGRPIRMSGKASYVYVDVFDYIDFDLSKPQGSGVHTGLNGGPAEYLKEIKDGDVIDIYWRK
ncbi:MAG: cell division protein FtsA [Lachnospiraceae bacterium]